jgi:hypothetical protein
MLLLCLLSFSFGAVNDYKTNDVTVTVYGQNGKPVSGASVRAWNETWGHFQPWDRYTVAKTDAQGQVKFKMMVGEWSIFAASDGLYLADIRHRIGASTKALSIRPDKTVTIEAQDIDGTALSEAEMHFYTAEHRPVVPLLVTGKLIDGKAKVAVMGDSTYGVMLVRQPSGDKPGLVLHWDRVKGSFKFVPNKEWLRPLTIKGLDAKGNPGAVEARISFPELTTTFDFRTNPGEFTAKVDKEATFLVEPLFVTIEAIVSEGAWKCRYFPYAFDLVKEPRVEVTFGGVHKIEPLVYDHAESRSATWIRTTDAAGHLSYEIKTPDSKLPALDFNFRDKDGKRLYGAVEGGQWAPAVRFDKDMSPEVTSFDGVIDYGPFGKRVFSGDPRSDQYAYKMDVLARSPHFELRGQKDPQVQHQIDVMLPWMEHLYNQYSMIWNLQTYVADKPVTVYYEPNLSNLYGGLAYGNKEISAWCTDLLDFADPTRNALCHMQNIMSHEFFHTCQAIPEMKWGGRTLYPDSWIGESMPQVAFNRIYLRYYGPVVAKMHKGIYLNGFLRRMAGEKTGGNKEMIWEAISADNGDEVHRKLFDLMGDEKWKPWDWMTKSNVDVRVAILALYKHLTAKNYAYVARLSGDTDITDKAVDEAAVYLKSEKSPFPERNSAPFITKWLVLGPFDDAKHEFLKKEQVPNEGKMNPKVGDKMLGKVWTSYESVEKTGFVDFEKSCAVMNLGGAFAYTTVNATQSGKAWVWFGSDDGAKLWINGKLVVDRDYHRPANPDDFIVPVELKAGKNTILVKCDQDSAQWGVYLRFTDQQGNAAAK